MGMGHIQAEATTIWTALLQSRMMLSSSLRIISVDGRTEEVFKTTISDILIADHKGRLIYNRGHMDLKMMTLSIIPNQTLENAWVKIVASLPGTDISITNDHKQLNRVMIDVKMMIDESTLSS
jgi:hypothetical protein